MKVPQSRIQQIKAILHGTQASFIFLTGCLVLAVLIKKGGNDGRVGYTLALCFLTIPALVYQVLVPMWTRAWRFANVYAYASLDILFNIFWLAAFAAMAAWNSEGLSAGLDECKSKSSKITSNSETLRDQSNGASCSRSCSNFGYGSESRCKVSQASVGFGVIVWLLFVCTSIISVWAVVTHRGTGISASGSHDDSITAKYTAANGSAWDASTTDVKDGFAWDGNGKRPSSNSSDDRKKWGQKVDEDHEGLLRPAANMTGPHPGMRVTIDDASSIQSGHEAAHKYDSGPEPSAISPISGNEQGAYGHGGRVQFPSANYSGY